MLSPYSHCIRKSLFGNTLSLKPMGYISLLSLTHVTCLVQFEVTWPTHSQESWAETSSSELTPQISLMNLQNQDAKCHFQFNQRTHFNCFQRHKAINLSSKWNKCLKKNVIYTNYFFPCDPSDLSCDSLGVLTPSMGTTLYPKCLIHLKVNTVFPCILPQTQFLFLNVWTYFSLRSCLWLLHFFMHMYYYIMHVLPAQTPPIHYKCLSSFTECIGVWDPHFVCVLMCVCSSWVIVLGLCCSCTLWISMQYKLSIHQILRTKECCVFWLILRMPS